MQEVTKTSTPMPDLLLYLAGVGFHIDYTFLEEKKILTNGHKYEHALPILNVVKRKPKWEEKA